MLLLRPEGRAQVFQMRGTDQAVRMNKYRIPMRHNLIFKAFVIPLRHLLTFLLSLRYKTSYKRPTLSSYYC